MPIITTAEKLAETSLKPIFPITCAGREHLPPAGSPAVYIANHQSFLDIFSLFHLDRSFKFVSKTSNFLIPIIGWSMFLTGAPFYLVFLIFCFKFSSKKISNLPIPIIVNVPYRRASQCGPKFPSSFRCPRFEFVLKDILLLLHCRLILLCIVHHA